VEAQMRALGKGVGVLEVHQQTIHPPAPGHTSLRPGAYKHFLECFNFPGECFAVGSRACDWSSVWTAEGVWKFVMWAPCGRRGPLHPFTSASTRLEMPLHNISCFLTLQPHM